MNRSGGQLPRPPGWRGSPVAVTAAFGAAGGVGTAAIGLGAAFLRLRAEMNFHRLFESAIEDFSVEGVGYLGNDPTIWPKI